ncbi:alpha/beta fold hydrolase [Terricaulis silvestris]|uniref:Tropinesterase n=1 Tax=Terricaulis silvestris TaxID=2686094 RepID=A0A6I6MHT9_9CAUL|nr:alpha/beta hydrolase [Terricaulis silvestris]QGZ94019.1 Tropinesterase [Terricaulis silvestris]
MDFGAPVSIGGFEERVIATIDGLTLYARDYPPLEPVTGLPVICLHGLTRNSRDFEVIAPRIAALGRRVIAADMRGRGKSANDPDPAHYVPAVYAQDVLKLMDTLEIPKAVFIGTSMGGLITMVLAALAPDRIAASVLNDVGPKLSAEGVSRIATYVGRSQPVASWAEAAQGVRAIMGGAFPERLDDEAFWLASARRTFRERDDGKLEADYDPHIALAFADFDPDAPPPDLTPLFAALSAKPMLSVRGGISDILDESGVAHMRALNPALEVATIDNVGHAPTLDEPEAWDAVLDFLAKVD